MIVPMLFALALDASSAALTAQPRESAEAHLERVVDHAIHADGPLLLADERALVERKCGYAPGSWDGRNFSMNNGALVCTNGRRIDDLEVRAMMTRAEPRIERRVNAAMARPEVVAAIEAVAREATAEAMARLGERQRRRR